MPSAMTKEEMDTFFQRVFPQIADEFEVEAVDDGFARMRLIVGERHLRPGGTVSGPSMFSLVDVCMYAAVLTKAGPKALAVTTNCSIDFMRKPAANTDLIGEARVLKFGKQLVVGDVILNSQGDPKPVARASATYALPPVGSAADIAL